MKRLGALLKQGRLRQVGVVLPRIAARFLNNVANSAWKVFEKDGGDSMC